MSATGVAAVSPRAAFAHRDFRYFVAARLAAALGVQMASVAVGWQVYALTGRPITLGYVGLAQFLPLAALSLLAGHAADRFDRRRILVACLAATAVGALALALLARWGGERLWPIYVVLALLGAARAFLAPSSQALVPELVPAPVFGNAVAWNASAFQVATIAGPAVGGLIYGWAGGAAPVYVVAAGLLAAAALLVAQVRARTGWAASGAPIAARLVAGVRYVAAKRVILGAISLDLFAVLLGGAVALLPIYARDILHVGPRGLGLLRSAPAVGAAAMAVLLAHRPLGRRAGPLLFGAVALFGAATIAFGLSRSFALSLAALAVVGAADMVSVVVRLTVVQLETPAEMRGRVSAVNMIFITSSNELGEFESGLTAAWLGPVTAVVLGGVGTLAVVALWALLFPQLRRASLAPATADRAPAK